MLQVPPLVSFCAVVSIIRKNNTFATFLSAGDMFSECFAVDVMLRQRKRSSGRVVEAQSTKIRCGHALLARFGRQKGAADTPGPFGQEIRCKSA
jgi:hypothetical protein